MRCLIDKYILLRLCPLPVFQIPSSLVFKTFQSRFMISISQFWSGSLQGLDLYNAYLHASGFLFKKSDLLRKFIVTRQTALTYNIISEGTDQVF